MIYLLLSLASCFFGLSTGLGASTLLRPMLDAISPLDTTTIAMLCTLGTLCAALVSAFFALGAPMPLHQDELLLLSVGAAVGGVLGELAAWRFTLMLPQETVVLLQNALLFTIVALPGVYFSTLSRTITPLSVTRLASLPVALTTGLIASFLAFGGEPLTLMVYYLLFDAEDGEGAIAALTVALFASAGKLLTMLIRLKFQLPGGTEMLWLLPGAIGGALLAMMPGLHRNTQSRGDALLRLSLFTSLLNMAAAIA